MNSIEIYTPFNEKDYINKSIFVWKLAYKKRIRISVLSFAIALIGFISCLLTSSVGDGLVILFMLIYFAVIVSAVITYVIYRKGFRLIYRYAKVKGKLEFESKKDPKWEFTDEYFHYQDSDYAYTISWRSMKGYLTADRHLIILPRAPFIHAIVLAENQVSPEKFSAILDLVKQNLRVVPPYGY